MKRFYSQSTAVSVADSWQTHLDGRPVKTPAKAPLSLPTKALAQAIADEWAAQGETIDPHTMPLTQYACSAIDRVRPAKAQIIAGASAFAETDLLAYPTDSPLDLRAQQDAAWIPLLQQLRGLGWILKQTDGLVSIDQDPDLRARAQAWLETWDAFGLTAIASLIEASGSFFLTYGLAQSLWAIDTLIHACTIEERYSLNKWGGDEEAEQLLGRREADLRTCAQMLNLLH